MQFTNNYSEAPIVIFGGAGYIGSVLVRRLISEGFRVRVFDNFLFGQDSLSGFSPDQLELVEGDLCDTKAVSFATVGAETVVLLAAIVGHRIRDPGMRRRTIRDINLLGSSVVLDAAIEHGASRFIFASTDSVYGVQSGIMFETGTPEPVSLYSRLKLRMEERVMNAKRRDFHPTALRIATCHGLSSRMRFDLVANSIVRDAVCRKKVQVLSGDQVRPLVHVEDVSQALVRCIRAHVNLVSGEIFNVGSEDQNVSVNQMVNYIQSLEPDVQVEFEDGEPDLLDYYSSWSKIKKVLDYEPLWTLEDSMKQLHEQFKNGRFEDPYSLRFQSA